MGKSEGVFCVQFARDGRLATGGADGVVRVWGEEGRRLLYAFSGHPGRVLSVAWTDRIDRQWLGSGGEDGTFNIWDTEHGRLLRSVPGHTGAVSSIGWAGPWAAFYTAGEDGTVRWGLLESGDCSPLFPPSEYRGHVVATSSPYWVTFAGADDSVYTWDTEFQRVDVKQSGYTSRVVAMAWAPSAYLLATATADGTLHLSQFGRGYQARRFAEHGAAVSSVAWSPDGRQLASAGADGTVRVWDVESAREVRCLSGHSGRALSVSWAPSGQRLASAGDDGVCLWDPGTGELLGRLPSDATPETPPARPPVEEPRSPSVPEKPPTQKEEERPSFVPISFTPITAVPTAFEPVSFVPISAVADPLPPLPTAPRSGEPKVQETIRQDRPGLLETGFRMLDGTWETAFVGGTQLPNLRVVLTTVGSTLSGELWEFHVSGHRPILEVTGRLTGTLQEDGSAEWAVTEQLVDLGAPARVRGRFIGHTFQGTFLQQDGSPQPRGTFELRLVSRVTRHEHSYEP